MSARGQNRREWEKQGEIADGGRRPVEGVYTHGLQPRCSRLVVVEREERRRCLDSLEEGRNRKGESALVGEGQTRRMSTTEERDASKGEKKGKITYLQDRYCRSPCPSGLFFPSSLPSGRCPSAALPSSLPPSASSPRSPSQTACTEPRTRAADSPAPLLCSRRLRALEQSDPRGSASECPSGRSRQGFSAREGEELDGFGDGCEGAGDRGEWRRRFEGRGRSRRGRRGRSSRCGRRS